MTRKLTIAVAVVSALALACAAGGASAGELSSPTLLTSEAGGSGSTVGPDGAHYVTDGADGRVLRVDPTTGPRPGAVVLPPGKRVDGRSLAEWQREFFRWTSLIPTDGPQPHPGLTQGDVDCSYAQRGHVWFLELGGVERRCSIPFGKTLYVPVNFWACLPEADLVPFPQCEAEGDGFLAVATFTLTLDGRSIDLAAWRAETGRFTLELADQNVWEAFFGFDDLGRTTPFSADGVGALVLLGPGRHTVVAGLAVDADGDGTPEHTSETSYEIRVTLGQPR